MILNLCRSWLTRKSPKARPSAARRPTAPRGRARPVLEALEDRCVPSTYQFASFDVPGLATTFVRVLNNAGQAAGFYYDGGHQHGFVRDADGSFTTLDAPGSGYTAVSYTHLTLPTICSV